MQYRAVATSVEGFVQQIACCYLRHGYWFYVTGQIPAGKDPLLVDAKLIAKYGVAVSESTRGTARKPVRRISNTFGSSGSSSSSPPKVRTDSMRTNLLKSVTFAEFRLNSPVTRSVTVAAVALVTASLIPVGTLTSRLSDSNSLNSLRTLANLLSP